MTTDSLYQPFYIWIAGTADAPTVAVDHAPGGDLAQGSLDLREVPAVVRLLAGVRAGGSDLGTVAALGRGLFALLFTPPLLALYQRSLGRLGAGQRLRLLLRCDVPEYAALPWEMLCNPQTNEFLALDPLTSLARYLPQTARPAPPTRSGPLRILAVFAGPQDQPPLDLARELGLILQAARGLDPTQVTLDILMDAATATTAGLGVQPLGPPTPDTLGAVIAAGYDVLHYGGHGALLADGGGVLALEDGQRQTVLFDSESLAVAVRGSRLRLAVLTACETAASRPGTASALNIPGAVALREFRRPPEAPPVAPLPTPLPVAPALVRAGLGAVIAMQFRIPDDSAVLFSRALYRDLGRNTPVDAAVSQARKEVRLANRNVRADWAIPVLFLQEVGEGRLWTTPAPAATAGPAPTPAPAAPTGGSALGGFASEIEFRGPTTIINPSNSGAVDQRGMTINMGAGGLPAPTPDPTLAPDRSQQLRPAFLALVAAIDDDTLLERARELHAELLAPTPTWRRIVALRQALAGPPALAEAVEALFANPAVRTVVQEAKLRAIEQP